MWPDFARALWVYNKSSLELEAAFFPQFALCKILLLVRNEYLCGTKKSMRKARKSDFGQEGQKPPIRLVV
jgi:hypothetical protein